MSVDAPVHAFGKGLGIRRAPISLVALGNTLGGIVGHRVTGARHLVAFSEAADILRVAWAALAGKHPRPLFLIFHQRWNVDSI